MSVEFTSAGCNRVVNALDWGGQDVLAYGAHNVLIIYDAAVSPFPRASLSSGRLNGCAYVTLSSFVVSQEAKVLGTLLGHSGRIDCVRWLPGHTEGREAPQHTCMLLTCNVVLSLKGTLEPWLMTPSGCLRMSPCRSSQGTGVRKR